MQSELHLQIDLHSEAFEPLLELQQWQLQLRANRTGLGAAEGLFIGRVRPTASDGSLLSALELEHYPGMTERQLLTLASACGQRHLAQAVLIKHRIGRVLPGEAIVLVSVAADRRGPAQRCCQEVLEALKHEAPFWKREWRDDGSSEWLTGNTPL
jgi:molybdopterin synthase catalytic subunit